MPIVTSYSPAQDGYSDHDPPADRLHAAWRLSLYGLRRSEVLDLRWSDIDLTARTLTVNQVRVLVDYKVRIEPPRAATASGPYR